MKNLLTRHEIIDIWSRQNKKHLNKYCCPNCRDLLYSLSKDGKYLGCLNSACSEFEIKIDNPWNKVS